MPGHGLADWVSALERAGCHPRKSGGGWSARCPSHDDKHPSLTLREGDTQPVVATCHAGCEFEQVRAALGLDRWDGRPADLQVVVERPAKNRDHKPRQLPNGPGEQSWIYTDAAGAPLMATLRRDPPSGGKAFSQWRPVEGGWVSEGIPSPRPLYRLDELAADPEGRVVVVEGEKCADAYRRAWPERLVTTWPGGCKQWQQTDWTPLKGREVAVLADADTGGREAVEGIAAELHKLGCTVQVALPEGETGEDVADWIEADGADAALERIAELLGPFQPPAEPGPEPAAEAEREGGELSEHAVAVAFTARHGGTLRYDHDRGRWYEWAGDRWAHDRKRQAFDHVRRIAAVLAGEEKGSRRVSAERSAFAAGVEKFAQADRSHAVEVGYFDADPWLMGVPGGTLDLKTQQVIAPEQEHRISLQAAVAPADEVDCPIWLAFLDETFGGDIDLIALQQRFAGYCLTGDTSEQAMSFAHGHGANGKSVYYVTVAGIMGEYHVRAAMETFVEAKGERHSTGVAALAGARLVTATETEQGRVWNEALVKDLTGGEPMTARFMRRDFFTFQPACKLAFQGNYLPTLRSADVAMRRRFLLIPFTNQVPDEQQDPELAEKLRVEWPGILRWMLDWLADWQQKGLGSCEAVEAETDTYFDDNDTVGQWLQAECQLHPGTTHSETAEDLCGSWKAWCARGGHDPGTATSFGLALGRKGLVKHKGHTVRWKGVQIVNKREFHSEQGFSV